MIFQYTAGKQGPVFKIYGICKLCYLRLIKGQFWCVFYLSSFWIMGNDNYLVSQEKVTWNTFNMQGVYASPSQSAGFLDKQLEFVIDQHYDYQHTIQEMPLVRIFKNMENISEGIFACFGKTELPEPQASKVLQSVACIIWPPPGIVIRKRDAELLLSPEGKLFNGRTVEKNGKEKIRLGWVRGATIHPIIRDMAHDHIKNGGRSIHLFSNIAVNISKMLLEERIDCFPTHAVQFRGMQEQDELGKDKLVYFPIKEVYNFLPAYVFAAKTPSGFNFIERMNHTLQSDEFKELTYNLITERFPENMIDEYLVKNREMINKPLSTITSITKD